MPWQWWTAIGLPPKWASRLAGLNLRWDGASLRLNVGNIDPSSCDVTDVVQTARECILHVWRFKKFSEGRWASITESSKTLIASLALGLDSVVDAVRGRESETDYYLHGYTRFSVELRRACSVAAIVGNVAGHMIESLLEDDRVCVCGRKSSVIN